MLHYFGLTVLRSQCVFPASLSLSIYHVPTYLYLYMFCFLCLSAQGLTNKIADFLEIQSNTKLMQIAKSVHTTHIYLVYYPAFDLWMSSSASILSKQFSDITECLQGIKNWLCNNDLEVERAHRWQQKAIRDQVPCGIWDIVCMSSVSMCRLVHHILQSMCMRVYACTGSKFMLANRFLLLKVNVSGFYLNFFSGFVR